MSKERSESEKPNWWQESEVSGHSRGTSGIESAGWRLGAPGLGPGESYRLMSGGTSLVPVARVSSTRGVTECRSDQNSSPKGISKGSRTVRRKTSAEDEPHETAQTTVPGRCQAMSLTPAERTMRARLAAHTLHAKVDSSEHTKPARKAFLERFEDEVDPDRTLPRKERLRRAEQAKKAYFTRLALKSAQVRRRDRGLI